MMRQQRCILVVVWLVGTIVNNYVATGQKVIGTDLCACQPRSFDLKLNFTSTCGDNTFTNNSGVIQPPSCAIRGDGTTDIADQVPVLITTIQIVELGENFTVVAQAAEDNVFTEDSSLSYVSIIDQPSAINTTTLPRGIQIVLTGKNALNQTLLNVFVITFNNNCSIYPVIEEGASIGWAVFVSNVSYVCVDSTRTQ
jgi:hypothetical protein